VEQDGSGGAVSTLAHPRPQNFEMIRKFHKRRMIWTRN
jgi:hypothetical protein